MVLGYTFVVLGLGLLVEGWREVYQARKEGRLATGGLYGLVRHPQYTGIFVALFGQLVHWPTVLTLLLFPVIVWVYVRLARGEEKQMIEQFGEAYEDYRQRVPMFFPKWGSWRTLVGAIRFSAGESERSGADGNQSPPVDANRHGAPGEDTISYNQRTHNKEERNGSADAIKTDHAHNPGD
jgi:hypothetical protein